MTAVSALEKSAFYAMVGFYLFAGANHFLNPSFYAPVIPPYLSAWGMELNLAAGIAEIAFALLLLPKRTRRTAGILLVLMLAAFIPSHVWFIEQGAFRLGGLTVEPWFSWVRLVVMQPLLMAWAWWAGGRQW